MSSRLRFRNVDADPDEPVETWPYEAIVAAFERGTIGDWVRVTAAIDRDPWGGVARQVEEYLGVERPAGLASLLERAIARARAQQSRRERDEVSAEVRRLVESTGQSMAQVARRLGTSRTRLSTYRSGSVTPSASFMVRLRALAVRTRSEPHAGTDGPRGRDRTASPR